MLYIVTNVSNHNIAHGNDIIKPGENRKVLSIDNLSLMIKCGHMKCESIGDTSNIVENKKEEIIHLEKKHINKELNKDLTEALFKFYLNNEIMDNKEIELIKDMYKNLIIFNDIDKSFFELFDEVNSREELIEILLNYIYPLMLNNITKDL